MIALVAFTAAIIVPTIIVAEEEKEQEEQAEKKAKKTKKKKPKKKKENSKQRKRREAAAGLANTKCTLRGIVLAGENGGVMFWSDPKQKVGDNGVEGFSISKELWEVCLAAGKSPAKGITDYKDKWVEIDVVITPGHIGGDVMRANICSKLDSIKWTAAPKEEDPAAKKKKKKKK